MNTLEKQIQQIDMAIDGLMYIIIAIVIILIVISIKYYKTKIKDL